MKARAAEPRQKHIPAGQPCRIKFPKDWFRHKQQLTDHDWQDGWQEGSFLGFLPPSISVDMSCHFCHETLWYMFVWHNLMFMGNQTYFLAQSATRQEEIPVSNWQKPVKSKSPHPKTHPEQDFSCLGNTDRSAPLLLGLSGALTHSHYPTVINASDITHLHYHLHHCCHNFRSYICQRRCRPGWSCLSKQTTIDILVLQRGKSHSQCMIRDRNAEGPGKKGKPQSQRGLSCKVRTLNRNVTKSSDVNPSSEVWQSSPNPPGCWSEQSTLKSPCEASDRINQLIRRWIQERKMPERDTQAREGLSARKSDCI